MERGTEIAYFKLIQPIGAGGFGSIWKVQSTEDDQFYAMKLEPITSKRKSLQFEASIMKKLNTDCFPRYITEGTDKDHNFLTMELLGPNLGRIAQELPEQHFGTEFIPRMFCEMLKILEHFHSAGYVHRDIKPENFVVRFDGKKPICLIDYGVSRLYRNPDGTHLEPRQRAATPGSQLYASINCHSMTELSRRDDLISLLYTIMVLAGIHLPWSGQNCAKTEVAELKRTHTATSLIAPLGEPFVGIARHIEGLEYVDTPNYKGMIQTIESSYPKTTVPFQWMNMASSFAPSPAFGAFDPTGFLHQLAPYSMNASSTENKQTGCIVC